MKKVNVNKIFMSSIQVHLTTLVTEHSKVKNNNQGTT